MNKIFGSSWRTSLIGYISAAGVAVYPLIQDGNFDLNKDWKNLAFAAVIAIWGRIQKDSDGLTKQESQIVAKVATDGAIPPPDETKQP